MTRMQQVGTRGRNGGSKDRECQAYETKGVLTR